MRGLMPHLLEWWRDGRAVGMASVVSTSGSAPRPAGTTMLIGPDGSVVGSVSGGCVEGAVYELAPQVVASGDPVLERYGVSDDEAFAVGLTCGGTLDVFVEKVDQHAFPQLDQVAADLAARRPVAIATVIGHPDRERVGRRLVVRPGAEGSLAETTAGSLGGERLDAAVRDDSIGLLGNGQTQVVSYGANGERRGADAHVFVRALAPRPRMIVFGSTDVAAALAQAGSFVGYRVTVCDARPVFATRTRFPGADEVVVDWPHRYLVRESASERLDGRTVVAVLTHDPKFDVPLLEVALRLPGLAYVGAMGSRRTHDDRMERLCAAGLEPVELARLRSPIGLDLGARTAEETAISILAEIVADRWGGSGAPLSSMNGRIHHEPTPAMVSS